MLFYFAKTFKRIKFDINSLLRSSKIKSLYQLLLILGFIGGVYTQAFASGYAFPTFNSGVITGGGAAYTKSLDTSGLTDNYLFYTVTGDFVGGANPAYSETIQLELNNGGSTVYLASSRADIGSASNADSTTLKWSGVFGQIYQGGGNFTVKILDTYNDALGPYTSTLSNVKVVIYAVTPEKLFSSFTTGVITGGGAAYTKSLDTSGLTDNYLFYTVTGDFVGGANPAYSETIQLELNNGGSTVYLASSRADIGSASNADSTTLKWSGVFRQIYQGGGNLTVKILDTYNDASGPYTSTLSDVKVTIYSEPTSVSAPMLKSFVRHTPATSTTNADTLVFRATFDKDVQNVDILDFSINGATTATISNVSVVTPSTVYDITVSGGDLAGYNGIVGLDLSGTQDIIDLSGNALPADEPGIDMTYTLDNEATGLISFSRQSPSQDTTNADTLVFRATFIEDVQNVDVSDFLIDGATTAIITNVSMVTSSTVYDITVTGGDLAGYNGIVGLNLAGTQDITDLAGNAITADEPGTDDIYTLDNKAPTVIINQAAGQMDPATGEPINYTVTFSETVVDFDDVADITLSGTASPMSVVITGTGPYNIAVTGMGSIGTVIANIGSAIAYDAAGNMNVASTSTDNEVTYSPAAPTVVSINRVDADPTNSASVDFAVVFDQNVTGIDTADFSLTTSGTTGNIASVSAASGSSVTVTVDTITGDGTLGLNLVDNDTILNMYSLPIGGVGVGNGDFIGQFYTVDRVAPRSTAFTRQTPLSNLTNVDSLIFRATFDENVQNVDTSDFIVNGTTTATVSNVAEVMPGTVYAISVSGGDLAGYNGMVGINFNGGQNITDQLGNALPPGEPAIDQTYSLDNTAPSTTPPDMTPTTDTGESNNDNNTYITTPTFTGIAEINSNIILTSSINGEVGTASADNLGNWIITTSTLAPGAHNMTVTATDQVGNTSAASAALTIYIDNESPVISGMPADINVNTDPGLSTAIVDWLEPTASDFQDGPLIPVLTGGLVSGSPFPVGLSTVSYTATDSAGNSTTESFSVNVVQKRFPWWILLPGLVSQNKVTGLVLP